MPRPHIHIIGPKSELLSRAKRIFKGSAWLPEPLRTLAPVPSPAIAIAAE